MSFKIDKKSQTLNTLNALSREKMKERLLQDILFDLTVCEIEGWDKMVYLNELRELINGLCVR